MFAGFNHIRQAAEKIAAGNLTTCISGERLSRPMKALAKDINNIGNGLGLSIAKSLTDLQHGTFEIQIDGDLFKAIITLPLLKDNEPSHTME